MNAGEDMYSWVGKLNIHGLHSSTWNSMRLEWNNQVWYFKYLTITL